MDSQDADKIQLRKDLEQVQVELSAALDSLLTDIGHRLKQQERDQIRLEVAELNELLERLKTGVVWICIFGKASVGKSSTINALLGHDSAEVHVTQDTTKTPQTFSLSYQQGRWNIVDVPGIMGDRRYENIALEEAKKAHGHIFVLDGEPYQDELESFDLIHQKTPAIPKIVFVNKWDQVKISTPRTSQEIIKAKITQKMLKYAKTPDNIVYGSSMLYDPVKERMIRQSIPQLLECLYNGPGVLGAMMNILDPADQVQSITATINSKVLAAREAIVRKSIRIFGAVSITGSVFPLDTISTAPILHRYMVRFIFQTMGWKDSDAALSRKADHLVKDFYKTRWIRTLSVGFTEVILSSGILLGPIGYLVETGIELATLSVLRFHQTVILGEVAIEYAKHDFSWGGENPQSVIQRCKKQAREIYSRYATLLNALPPLA